MTRIINQQSPPNETIKIYKGETRKVGIRINPRNSDILPTDSFRVIVLLPGSNIPVYRPASYVSGTNISMVVDQSMTSMIGKVRCQLMQTRNDTEVSIGDTFFISIIPLGSSR